MLGCLHTQKEHTNMDSAASLELGREFDGISSRERCRQFRRRILDLSQNVSALHIAPAFSCMEILDTIYFGLMRRTSDG